MIGAANRLNTNNPWIVVRYNTCAVMATQRCGPAQEVRECLSILPMRNISQDWDISRVLETTIFRAGETYSCMLSRIAASWANNLPRYQYSGYQVGHKNCKSRFSTSQFSSVISVQVSDLWKTETDLESILSSHWFSRANDDDLTPRGLPGSTLVQHLGVDTCRGS